MLNLELLIGYFAECGIADFVNAEKFLAFWQTPREDLHAFLCLNMSPGDKLIWFSKGSEWIYALALSSRSNTICLLSWCVYFGIRDGPEVSLMRVFEISTNGRYVSELWREAQQKAPQLIQIYDNLNKIS